MTVRLIGFILGFWLTVGLATSVREVSLEEMLTRSDLVFEGEVIAVEVQEVPNLRPYTRILFRVLDVIKGSWREPTIALDFLGGEVGSKRFEVAEMDYPELGEHGIYFVESLRRRLVHPLYGWSQGRFITRPDKTGQLRIHSASGQPVVGIQWATQKRPKRLSRGVAQGVAIRSEALAEEALALEEFKRRLRRHLQEQR
ncbi:MAG: hypothetical protein N3A55_10365 [Methylohalobius sp.]|nr:hypothetical protein [Methylohalobius sp.]